MDDLDRLLMSDDAIAPSTRFSARVMEAIAVEEVAPPKTPFPWTYFVLGVLGCCAWAACGLWLVELGTLAPIAEPIAALATATPELGYALTAVGVCLVAVQLPRRRRVVAM